MTQKFRTMRALQAQVHFPQIPMRSLHGIQALSPALLWAAVGGITTREKRNVSSPSHDSSL